MSNPNERISRAGGPFAAKGVPLSPRHREVLRGLVQREGEPRAAELLSVSRSTIARLMAGLGCVRNIVAVAGQRLDELAPHGGPR